MKNKIIMSFICFVVFATTALAQTANAINIQDTRAVNDLPNFFGHGIRADFKQIGTIGVPGQGYYGTNITIGQWDDWNNSGGKNHQLNFNDGGFFYRSAYPMDPQWGTWRQVLMTNENGNVGIGTSAPSNDQGWSKVLDVAGSGNSKILATSDNASLKTGVFTHSSWHGGGGFVGTESNHSLFLLAGYDPKMTILTNGNVGIGSKTPAQRLTVDSKQTLMNAGVPAKTGDVQNGIMRLQVDGNSWGEVLDIGMNVVPTYAWLQATNRGNLAVNYNLSINPNGGNVGIGTTSPVHKLDVIGTIRSREVKVDMNGADFVFEEKYPLMPLTELEAYVKKNKHLPEIATAKEMQEQGSNLGDLNTKLLQKIEELTLYVIEQQKLINQQAKELESHKVMLAKIDQMEKTLAKMNTANEK